MNSSKSITIVLKNEIKPPYPRQKFSFYFLYITLTKSLRNNNKKKILAIAQSETALFLPKITKK